MIRQPIAKECYITDQGQNCARNNGTLTFELGTYGFDVLRILSTQIHTKP